MSKRFDVFESQRSRLLHAVWPAYRHGMHEVWALRDVDFDVQRGESVAIIGRNGGGKSTLLQIVTGTLRATTGEATVHGRVGALLELGSGFNPEYSGRDNVLLNGLLLGFSREEMRARMDEILAFAEIGEAIDRPVRTYSSGMVMRLAFAVQAICRPEVLIIDEALSVGDFFFQQKCLAHVRSLQRDGVTLLFVSHDMGMVRNLCSRAVYLRAGRVAYVGDADKAALLYFQEKDGPGRGPAGVPSEAAAAASAPTPFFWRAAEVAQHGPALAAMDFRDAFDRPSLRFRMGESMKVVLRVVRPSPRAIPAILVKNALGQSVNVSYFDGELREAGAAALYTFELSLVLEAGRYSFQAYLGEPRGPNVGDVVSETPALGPITVEWDYDAERAPFYGMFGLPAQASVEVLPA